ncbi:MAG: SAM-dependent methyltransferase [Planctomycetota bacterium]|jgi:SAM-dependent methyltransferase
MPAIEALDWYDTPLYYDLVFDEDTDLEADFLEAVAERYGRGLAGTKRRILEPACGSGRLVEAMLDRGWRVTGTDLSQPMLDYTAERLASTGHKAKLLQANMAAPQPKGPFDLAHCLVSTFKYLLTAEDARSHLAGVAEVLAPGGLYVLGFHLSNYERENKERERWTAERDGIEVVCNIQGWPPDRRKRLEKIRSRLVVTEDGRTRRTETNWTFRTYSASQVRDLLAEVPAFEHVATYDFTYDMDAPLELRDDGFDTVLILRKL